MPEVTAPIVSKLFEFTHPVHGYYAVYYDQELKTYGITKSGQPCWCAYASLTELFKQKGL